MALSTIAKHMTKNMPTLWRVLNFINLLRMYLFRQPYHPEYAAFASIEKGLLLDIGANTGQSAFSFAVVTPQSSILSLEPNPRCETELKMVKRLLGKRFNYRIAAAGASAGHLTLYIPVKGTTELTQEGSFFPEVLQDELAFGRFGKPDSIAERLVPVLKLDDMKLQPAGIKIDVQGHEISVLEGLRNTIETCRPLIMIENQKGIEDIILRMKEYGCEPKLWIKGAFATYVPGYPTDNIFFAHKP